MHVTLIGNGRHDTLKRDGMIIALVSAKGSPGTTTTALGIAARWPGPGAVVVEADPAGGDLAARFGRDFERGIAAVALDSRQPHSDLDPERWLQALPCGVSALLAPPGAEASASLMLLAERTGQLVERLAGEHPAVVVDAGRWSPGSAAESVLAAADVLLLVVRPVLDELNQAEARIEALRTLNADLGLVLVGDGDWPPKEIGARLRAPVLNVLPADRHGASVLSGRSVPRRGWDSKGWTRLPLLRACHALANTLAEAPPTAPAPGPALDRPVGRVEMPAVPR